jgi:DNA excision repair protein ERCC-2
VPDAFVQALQTAGRALAEHFNQHPLALGPLLNFHFELQRFHKPRGGLERPLAVRRADPAGRASGVEGTMLAAESAADGSAALCVRNVAPAVLPAPRFKALHSVTLFSATLARRLRDPVAGPAREHGLDRRAAGLCRRAPERARGRRRLDALAHRSRSLQRLVGVIARQFDAHPGNYLAFFSSFDYLDKAADLLAAVRPDMPQWRQDAAHGRRSARQRLPGRFRPKARASALRCWAACLPKAWTCRAAADRRFIATLGLPPVSPVTQDHMQARLDSCSAPAMGTPTWCPACSGGAGGRPRAAHARGPGLAVAAGRPLPPRRGRSRCCRRGGTRGPLGPPGSHRLRGPAIGREQMPTTDGFSGTGWR